MRAAGRAGWLGGLTLLAGLAGAPAATACSCRGGSLVENFQQCQYVLRGRVVGLLDTVQHDLYSQPVRPPFRAGYQARVQVSRVYKGRKLPATVRVEGFGGNCDFRFSLGGEYVLFVDRQRDGRFITSICVHNFSPSGDTAALRTVEQLAALAKQ